MGWGGRGSEGFGSTTAPTKPLGRHTVDDGATVRSSVPALLLCAEGKVRVLHDPEVLVVAGQWPATRHTPTVAQEK